MASFSREYYMGDTVDIARNLLGKTLVRVYNSQPLVFRITETEAYVGRCDKACHAYGYHRTARNTVMFGPPGHAYIYSIYGMYHCLNLVTEPEGEPSAVLIRGLEALSSEEVIRRLRFGDGGGGKRNAYQKKNFLNGPGKLCKGLSLTTAENGLDLTEDVLFLCESPRDLGLPCPSPKRERICAGPRVGIDYAEEARDFLWRFWLKTEE